MEKTLRTLWTFCCAAIGTAWRVVWRALVKYDETDGEQRAASFAYYAFFALLPLILLLVSIGSIFVDQARVAEVVVNFVSRYLPAVAEQEVVIETISGVVRSRKGASVLALVAITWGSLGFFHALVRGVNRAWGTLEYPWWKLPFKNLIMIGAVGSALLIGVVTPAVLDAIEAFTWRQPIPFGAEILARLFGIARRLVPTLVLFYGFSMLYKFAPRRKTAFGEVWVAALTVAILLQVLQNLFVLYLASWTNFKSVYGAFGSVVALMLWIYLSGSIIIFGGCLSAAQAEIAAKQEDQATRTKPME